MGLPHLEHPSSWIRMPPNSPRSTGSSRDFFRYSIHTTAAEARVSLAGRARAYRRRTGGLTADNSPTVTLRKALETARRPSGRAIHSPKTAPKPPGSPRTARTFARAPMPPSRPRPRSARLRQSARLGASPVVARATRRDQARAVPCLSVHTAALRPRRRRSCGPRRRRHLRRPHRCRRRAASPGARRRPPP